MKRKYKKSVEVSKQSQIVLTRKEQVPTKSVSQEKYVNQYVIQEIKKKQTCRSAKPMLWNDKNHQSNVCSVKKPKICICSQ